MMETIKNLVNRLGPTGGLVLLGIILIIYIGLGFLWWQQGANQREYEEQIVKLSAILAKQLPSMAELNAKYEECNLNLAPMTDSEAIELLVSIAEFSGIDISKDGGKFRVPSAIFNQTKVGEGDYQIVSFKNIHVQGDYDNVMAFISILDSGSMLETMVLKEATTSKVVVTLTGEERDRTREFQSVSSAVSAMMADNYLLTIPRTMSFVYGFATNLMGDDPTTGELVEGFPDIYTTTADKGYTGTGNPRGGYVLNRHDKISEQDSTEYQTVSYLPALRTTYYYTCEEDGTVRQWDSPNLATATEYLFVKDFKIEIKASLDVDIYVKPR